MIKEEEKWDHAVATGLHSNNSTALAFGMEKLIQMINSSEGSKKKKDGAHKSMYQVLYCIVHTIYKNGDARILFKEHIYIYFFGPLPLIFVCDT